MKRLCELLLILIVFVPTTTCIISACVLAYNGVSGWGFFLAVGCLTIPTYSYKGRK